MPTIDLKNPEAIKEYYHSEFLPSLEQENRQQWPIDYAEIVNRVQAASPEELATPEMQTLLWEGNHISGQGMCTIKMQPAIESPELAQWIAGLRDQVASLQGQERVRRFASIYSELETRTKALTKRTPRLKILRLLAAMFPNDFCCLVGRAKLRQVVKAMFGKVSRDEANVASHNNRIYRHLERILGPVGDDTESKVRRAMFPWDLYLATESQGEEQGGEQEGTRPGETKLVFFDPERRTKGLTAFKGDVNTCLQVLDFVQNGATRSETLDFLKELFPKNKENTLKSILSNIRHQLGLLALDGDNLCPSALGEKLLDSNDPTVLIPRILTRVIGYDVILFLLKEKSLDRGALIAGLQQYYPRWTTGFAPTSQLKWAVAIRMVVYENQLYSLTEAGAEYAAHIQKKPPPFVFGDGKGGGDDVDPSETFQRPELSVILNYFEKLNYVFPPEVVTQLHVALHMHPTKHFVLLSGLSGTGKTKLAELYANAYHQVEKTEDNRFFSLIPVQPDWTDPTGLLGYVNPLRETPTYASTEFLTFLQSAVEKRSIPHFVCLDEMNLARVEYYFAPFLSAMETAQDIVIHQNDEPVDAVEPRLPWPDNLYVIGTVNMDETTHAFSDKVLDRAFTIEFWDVDLVSFEKQFAKGNAKYPKQLMKKTMEILRKVQQILEPAHQHFGYRAAEEVLRFLWVNKEQGNGVLNADAALDQAILMKVMPKIRGQDSSDFRSVLAGLRAYLEEKKMVASAKKIGSMYEDLELTGTTKFWR